MTLEEFDEWDKVHKTKYPILFFLQETVPENISKFFIYTIGNTFDKIRWGATYRLFKQHQYHVIRPRTLKPSYYDQDTRIFHAVMECFISYYENNIDEFDAIEYPPGDEMSKVHIEMVEIAAWWMYKYPERKSMFVDGTPLLDLPNLPPEWGDLAMLRREYADEPEMKEWVTISHQHSENKAAWYEKENEILKRIIEIRNYLLD
ncbi:hypothetical protein MNBD_GAMMA08-1812 [hydrothermal vent metagenome]|uniref:Uncharacterized protein n=1 Tax=hydrothermal vent metagenome TaxID=652676 RepID=A0A3B0Y1G1_9ZZZZ